MRSLGVAFALAACACAPAPQPAITGLPAELSGRTAGTAQRCVPLVPGEALRVAEGNRNILLYGRGGTVWANRLAGGCTMRPGDILIIEPLGAQMCRGDRVRSVDPVSHFPGPGCALGDFMPYVR